jgi:hypothetical protein
MGLSRPLARLSVAPALNRAIPRAARVGSFPPAALIQAIADKAAAPGGPAPLSASAVRRPSAVVSWLW